MNDFPNEFPREDLLWIRSLMAENHGMEVTPKKGWRWTSYCHFFADSEEELHEFAKKIGMRRIWFQDKKLPHYDLTAQRRQLALSAGAIEIDSAWIKQKLRERK